jgi:hypothetical protein
MGVGLVPGLKRSIKHIHLQRTAHAPPPLPSKLLSLTSMPHAHAAGSSSECGASLLRCCARQDMTQSTATPQPLKLQRATVSLAAPRALTAPGSCARWQCVRATLHTT